MDISSLTIRIVLLAFPGLLGSQLYRMLQGKTEKKTWEDFTEIMTFSISSYLLLAFLKSFNWPSENDSLFCWAQLTTIDSFLDTGKAIVWSEIFWASVIALLITPMWALNVRKKWLITIYNKIGITNRYGEESAWQNFLDKPETKEWVCIRDHKLKLIYFGHIHTYSETNDLHELVLEDVAVLNSHAKELYETSKMYISRKNTDLSIELVNVKQEKEN